jgi:hypothetical protein
MCERRVLGVSIAVEIVFVDRRGVVVLVERGTSTYTSHSEGWRLLARMKLVVKADGTLRRQYLGS